MIGQLDLETMVRKKGTGKTMGKSLTQDDCNQLKNLFLNPDNLLATKATLLTALIMLPQNEAEAAWINQMVADPTEFIPPALVSFIDQSDNATRFEQFLYHAMANRSIPAREASEAFTSLFDETIPDYLKAAFLEALRLKRETEDENFACLEAIIQNRDTYELDIPFLIDIANGYDGFNRTPLLSLSVAVTLAAAGFPTVLHGVHDMGPKHGINPYKILKQAGKRVNYTLEEAGTELHDRSIGWAYVDQAEFCKPLNRLKSLRNAMIKRPLLATLEKLLRPLSANKTLLVTSYTHPPYKSMMTALIKRSDLFDQFILFRGVEGSTQLTSYKRAPYVFFSGRKTTSDYISPSDFPITQTRIPDSPIDAEVSLQAGMQALLGNKGPSFDLVAYNAAAILSIANLYEPSDAFNLVSGCLDSGKAMAHWERGMQK